VVTLIGFPTATNVDISAGLDATPTWMLPGPGDGDTSVVSKVNVLFPVGVSICGEIRYEDPVALFPAYDCINLLESPATIIRGDTGGIAPVIGATMADHPDCGKVVFPAVKLSKFSLMADTCALADKAVNSRVPKSNFNFMRLFLFRIIPQKYIFIFNHSK